MPAESIYVSYSWSAEDETRLVDRLEAACRKRGIELKRDRNQIGYGKSIRAYMDELAAGAHVILVLSEGYFKSEYCMYELREIHKNSDKDFRERVYPIVLKGTRFQKPVERVAYLQHWEAETAKLKTELEKVDRTYTRNLNEALDVYADFRRMMDELQAILTDMNSLTQDIHLETDFEALIDRVVSQEVRKEDSAVPIGGASGESGHDSQPTNNASEGRAAMGFDRVVAERIVQLDEQISTWQEKLHEFEMELTRAEGAEAKFSIKEKIKREIKPQLRDKTQEYANLLQTAALDCPLSDEEALPIVAELAGVVETSAHSVAGGGDTQRMLEEIRAAVAKPGSSAAAKLKVALPIIPMLAKYELELDTEKFVTGVWTKIRSLVSGKAKSGIAANPR